MLLYNRDKPVIIILDQTNATLKRIKSLQSLTK